MYSTNAMYVDYDPIKRPSAKSGTKWKNIISPIWNKKPLTIIEISSSTETNPPSSWLTSSVPDKLLDRYRILLESKKTRNTELNEEMVQIIKELSKQNEITDEEYP